MGLARTDLGHRGRLGQVRSAVRAARDRSTRQLWPCCNQAATSATGGSRAKDSRGRFIPSTQESVIRVVSAAEGPYDARLASWVSLGSEGKSRHRYERRGHATA